MLSLDDARWGALKGGYRVPFDPRAALRKLEEGNQTSEAWNELWQELYHQGDVGDASYAAVPHLVRVHRQRGVIDWNTYALVSSVVLASQTGKNPAVPEWLIDAFKTSIGELAQLGLEQLPKAANQETVRSILGLVAIWKGATTYGRLLVEFSEDEILELEQKAFG